MDFFVEVPSITHVVVDINYFYGFSVSIISLKSVSREIFVRNIFHGLYVYFLTILVQICFFKSATLGEVNSFFYYYLYYTVHL
jgi:hypothetical protein